jgi:hypothetical protein
VLDGLVGANSIKWNVELADGFTAREVFFGRDDSNVGEVQVSTISAAQRPTRAGQSGSDGGWHMQEKHEHVVDESIIYCFVDFQPASPTVHVIPSKIVAAALKNDHQTWLDTPGKYGQSHKPTSMRRLRPKMSGMSDGWMDEYFEAWSQFE